MRKFMGAVCIAILLGVGAHAVGFLQVYNSAMSTGVAIGDCYHWNVGFELRGADGPGFFHDVC